MAFERMWDAIAPTLFTADGSVYGIVTVASTVGFKVGAAVAISATGVSPLNAQVIRILSYTQLVVGPNASIPGTKSDLSLYLVALGASINQPEQTKREVGVNDKLNATYDGEPTAAWRTVFVDPLGKYYGTANPLPVQLSDGAISIQTLNAELNVQLNAQDNFPKAGDVHSSVRIGGPSVVGGSQINEAVVNPDGSFNVVVENITGASAVIINRWAEAASVPAGSVAIINTYTVPTGHTAFLQRASVSGENIARFDIRINGSNIDTKRTWWGNFNVDFNFTNSNPDHGYPLVAGDVITVVGLHMSQVVCDFDARIQLTQTPI